MTITELKDLAFERIKEGWIKVAKTKIHKGKKQEIFDLLLNDELDHLND